MNSDGQVHHISSPLDIGECLARYMQSANEISNSYSKLNAEQRLGVTHVAIGFLLIGIGLMFFFQSFLLSLGNLLLLYGLIEVMGVENFLNFLKPVTPDASNYGVFAYGLSMLLLMSGWGLFGFLLEMYSVYLIMKDRFDGSELRSLITVSRNIFTQSIRYIPIISKLYSNEDQIQNFVPVGGLHSFTEQYGVLENGPKISVDSVDKNIVDNVKEQAGQINELSQVPNKTQSNTKQLLNSVDKIEATHSKETCMNSNDCIDNVKFSHVTAAENSSIEDIFDDQTCKDDNQDKHTDSQGQCCATKQSDISFNDQNDSLICENYTVKHNIMEDFIIKNDDEQQVKQEDSNDILNKLNEDAIEATSHNRKSEYDIVPENVIALTIDHICSNVDEKPDSDDEIKSMYYCKQTTFTSTTYENRDEVSSLTVNHQTITATSLGIDENQTEFSQIVTNVSENLRTNTPYIAEQIIDDIDQVIENKQNEVIQNGHEVNGNELSNTNRHLTDCKDHQIRELSIEKDETVELLSSNTPVDKLKDIETNKEQEEHLTTLDSNQPEHKCDSST